MAYSAKLNGVKFFDTSLLENNQYLLTSAVLEMSVNSSGKFTFVVPPDNPACSTFTRLLDYVDVYRDNDLIFSGRVYSVEELFNNCRQIVCEGLLAMLGDTIFRPINYTGTLRNLFRAIILEHNTQVDSTKRLTVGNITVDDQNVYREFELYESSITRLRDLVETYGGYLMIRKLSTTIYIDWLKEFTSTSTQTIDFGSNILDLKKIQDSAGICTVVIPLGGIQDDGTRLTIKSINSGLDYLEASNLFIETYGRITKSVIFDDIDTDVELLKARGILWMSQTLLPKTTITVTAVDLADAGYSVQNFKIGQKISVTSSPNGIVSTLFDIQSQKLDLLRPEQNRLVLGTESAGYIEIQRQSRTQMESLVRSSVNQSQLQSAINDLSQLLTGQEGGFFVQRDTNNDGYIDEVLFMDTTDINTARNVWRFNSAGWGYSSNGYAGPYTTGASINGGIVGSFIQAGTVSADRIAANEVFTQALEAQNFKITGGSFQIEAASNTQSYIDIYKGLASSETSGVKTEISAQQIAKRGYNRGQEMANSTMSASQFTVTQINPSTGDVTTRSYMSADRVSTPRIMVTGGLFKDVEYSESITIAANSYLEGYYPLSPDQDYEISGFGGYYLTYGSQLHVYRCSINPGRNRLYYGFKNWSSSAVTTDFYYDIFMARTQD